MSQEISKLVDYLQLERIEENIFRGESRDLGTPQVYGGQVLGQAIHAAQQTVADRPVHSVHCYFLRRGDFNAPIIYEVDRSRDGTSFTARRVVAIQHGRPIFTLSASFQSPEPGFDNGRKIAMPPPPGLESGQIPPFNVIDPCKQHTPNSELEVCPVPEEESTDPLSHQWWLKTRHRLPDDDSIHRTILAYISDFGLLSAALLPYGISRDDLMDSTKNILFASIDHAIWFHRPFRVDDWLLYYMRPISTSSARGLAIGSLYTTDGTLVATTMQEGLVRQKTKA